MSYFAISDGDRPWRETPKSDPSIFATKEAAFKRVRGYPQFNRVVKLLDPQPSLSMTPQEPARMIAGYWVVET